MEVCIRAEFHFFIFHNISFLGHFTVAVACCLWLVACGVQVQIQSSKHANLRKMTADSQSRSWHTRTLHRVGAIAVI